MAGSAQLPPPAQSRWAYFLDLDGTLLELAVTPEAIHVDPRLPDLLSDLQRACAGAVALVSGRSLADLDRRLGVPTLPKAGQHGLERRDAAGRQWQHPPPLQAKLAIQSALTPVFRSSNGLLLEDKGLSLALHFRQAPELAGYVRGLAHRLVDEKGGGRMIVQEGKAVVEIKPAGIDKGTAIAEYLAEPPFAGRRPVFIGDDLSDEHGFAVVNERDGVSIGVGDRPSSARYRLAGVGAVRSWLKGALRSPGGGV